MPGPAPQEAAAAGREAGTPRRGRREPSACGGGGRGRGGCWDWGSWEHRGQTQQQEGQAAAGGGGGHPGREGRRGRQVRGPLQAQRKAAATARRGGRSGARRREEAGRLRSGAAGLVGVSSDLSAGGSAPGQWEPRPQGTAQVGPPAAEWTLSPSQLLMQTLGTHAGKRPAEGQGVQGTAMQCPWVVGAALLQAYTWAKCPDCNAVKAEGDTINLGPWAVMNQVTEQLGLRASLLTGRPTPNVLGGL